MNRYAFDPGTRAYSVSNGTGTVHAGPGIGLGRIDAAAQLYAKFKKENATRGEKKDAA